MQINLAPLRKLPDWVSVSLNSGLGTIALTESGGAQVEFTLTEDMEGALHASMSYLGGKVFEREHPGVWPELLRREAQLVSAGRELSPADARLKARLKELTIF